MRIFFFALLSLLLISGCSSSDQPSSPAGIWRLSEVKPIKTTSNSFSDLAESSGLVAEGFLLGIFDDGQAVELSGTGSYRNGTWNQGEKKRSVEISYPGKAKEYFTYSITKNEQQRELLSLKNELKNLEFSFVRDGSKLPDVKDEPFHPDNNRWRIRASSEEDSAKLRERLLNYIRHVALILKAADERKQDIVAFGQSQGPIRIYNGGIGIYPFDIVPDTWKNSFYSQEQALTTYKIYQQYLAEGSYQGAATGNWIKDDLSILLSIYTGMNRKALPAK